LGTSRGPQEPRLAGAEHHAQLDLLRIAQPLERAEYSLRLRDLAALAMDRDQSHELGPGKRASSDGFGFGLAGDRLVPAPECKEDHSQAEAGVGEDLEVA
jgi:hypothetical protein